MIKLRSTGPDSIKYKVLSIIYKIYTQNSQTLIKATSKPKFQLRGHTGIEEQDKQHHEERIRKPQICNFQTTVLNFSKSR